MSYYIQLAIVFLIFCSAQMSACYANENNLILNPGCEMDIDKNNIADKWQIGKSGDFPANWHMKDTQGIVKLDYKIAHNGKCSMTYISPIRKEKKIDETDAWDWNKWKEQESTYWVVPFISPEFKVNAGNKYRLSMWVKAENMMSLHIKVIWIDTAGKPVWRGKYLAFPREQKLSTYNWELWSAIVIAPPGMVRCRMDCVINEGETNGRVWIDDASAENLNRGE